MSWSHDVIVCYQASLYNKEISIIFIGRSELEIPIFQQFHFSACIWEIDTPTEANRP